MEEKGLRDGVSLGEVVREIDIWEAFALHPIINPGNILLSFAYSDPCFKGRGLGREGKDRRGDVDCLGFLETARTVYEKLPDYIPL